MEGGQKALEPGVGEGEKFLDWGEGGGEEVKKFRTACAPVSGCDFCWVGVSPPLYAMLHKNKKWLKKMKVSSKKCRFLSFLEELDVKKILNVVE